MDTSTRWTPVGTYAALAAFLIASALGAAALMHIGEHGSIPWSTLPVSAQRLAIAAEGAGLLSALCLCAGLFFGAGLFDAPAALRDAAHAALAVGAAALLAVHAGLATAHLLDAPPEVAHLALGVLGVAAAALLVAVAGTGRMRRMRAAKSPLRHRALAIALALVASAHILVAVSHSAMHGTFW